MHPTHFVDLGEKLRRTGADLRPASPHRLTARLATAVANIFAETPARLPVRTNFGARSAPALQTFSQGSVGVSVGK